MSKDGYVTYVGFGCYGLAGGEVDEQTVEWHGCGWQHTETTFLCGHAKEYGQHVCVCACLCVCV